MFATFLTVALFVAPAIQGALAEFAIATPTLTQCGASHVTWTEGTAPFNLIVVPASDPCADALVDLGDHSGQSITWTPALLAGTTVMLSLEDADGEEAWSGEITVGASSNTSCLPASLIASLSASAAASSSAAASAAVSSSAVEASASSVISSGTTLSVAGVAATTAKSSSHAAASSTASAVAVGAANAGTNPLSSGSSPARQISTPVMAISALIAVVALSL